MHDVSRQLAVGRLIYDEGCNLRNYCGSVVLVGIGLGSPKVGFPLPFGSAHPRSLTTRNWVVLVLFISSAHLPSTLLL